MKIIFAILAVAFTSSAGWAEIVGYKWNGTSFTLVEMETFGGGPAYSDWIVVKSSEMFTLDEFVKSGRFCAWRMKHEWPKKLIYESEKSRGPFTMEEETENAYCSLCQHKREKIKVQKESEEWEP